MTSTEPTKSRRRMWYVAATIIVACFVGTWLAQPNHAQRPRRDRGDTGAVGDRTRDDGRRVRNRAVDRRDRPTAQTGGATPLTTVEVEVRTHPEDYAPEWTIAASDDGGGTGHVLESGSGPGVVRIDGAAAGPVILMVYAPGCFFRRSRSLAPAKGEDRRAVVDLHAPATLQGMVHSASGSTIAGARVMLSPHTHLITEGAPGEPSMLDSSESGEPRQTVTGADGTYLVRNLDPRRRYSVSAIAASHAPCEPEALDLPAGETTTLDLTLVSGARVRGVVLGADGVPAADRKITLNGLRIGPAGANQWMLEAEAVADEKGAFLFDSLSPGCKELFVAVHGYRGRVDLVQRQFTLEAGRERDLGTLHVTGNTLTVLLRDPQGAPVSVGRVRVLDQTAEGAESGEQLILFHVEPGTDGRIELRGLPAGRLSVTARSIGFDGARHEGPPLITRQEIEYDGSTRTWEVVLEPEPPPEERAAPVALHCTGLDAETGLVLVVSDEDVVNVCMIGTADEHGGKMSVQPWFPRDRKIICVGGGRYAVHDLPRDERPGDEIRMQLGPRGSDFDVIVAGQGGARVPREMVFVSMHGEADSSSVPIGITDDKGVLRIRGLPPEPALWVAAGAGRHAGIRRVKLVPGGGVVEVVVPIGDD